MNLGDLVSYYKDSKSNDNSSTSSHPFASHSATPTNNSYPKFVPYNDKGSSSKFVMNKKKPKTTPPVLHKENKDNIIRCDSCDIYFKDKNLYDTHIASHVTCDYEGCGYSTSQVLMKIHQVLHANNMLTKLETPEQIEKYREERRKRFPTKANIEAKKGDDDSKSLLNNNANKNSKKKRRLCKYFKFGKCKKGDDCPFSHQVKRQKQSDNDDEEEDDDDLPVHVKRKLRRPKPVDSSLLLENIVKASQQKERKAILQCISYIVANNFFD